MVAYAAVSYEAKGVDQADPGQREGGGRHEGGGRRSGSSSFTDFKITESNFPTLPREQMREVVAEIDKAIPDDERVIGLDRVLASVDRSQIIPKDVAGREGGPPDHLLQRQARPPRQPRRRSHLEPHQGERPEVRGQHELGPLRARADEDVLPPQRRRLAEGGRRRRDRGLPRARCPRASRSFPPTTTGRR